MSSVVHLKFFAGPDDVYGRRKTISFMSLRSDGEIKSSAITWMLDANTLIWLGKHVDC